MECTRSQILSLITYIEREAKKQNCSCCINILRGIKELAEDAATNELRKLLIQ